MNKEKTKLKNEHPMDNMVISAISKSIPKVGDVIKGTVVSVGKNEIIIDIPGLTTGVVRGWEIIDESGQMTDIKINDEVQATVIDLENERGMIELSFRIAGHQKAWDNLNKLKVNGEIVTVKTIEANKGGLIVELGKILGFLPVSQLSPEHYPRVEGGNKNKILERLKELIAQTFEVKVIDIDESEEKLIVSERAVEEEKQIQALAGYKQGDVLTVKIVGIVDFGLFVEIPINNTSDDQDTDAKKQNNIEGLIHISEISWQRVDNLKDRFQTGESVEAKIIEIKNSRVSLSIKQLLPDPWKEAAEHFHVGQVISGKVVKLNDFGAFVELDHNIHGLAHISELSPDATQNSTANVTVGETYDFKIINMEPEAHRLGLSRNIKKELPQEEKSSTHQDKPSSSDQTKPEEEQSPTP